MTDPDPSTDIGLVWGSEAAPERPRRPAAPSALPWSVPAVSHRFWTDTTGGTVPELAREFVRAQARSAALLGESLMNLAHDPGFRTDPTDTVPPQVAGRVLQPDGSPGARLQVSLGRTRLDPQDATLATAFTGADGSYLLSVPARLRTGPVAGYQLEVVGDGGRHVVTNPFTRMQRNGLVGVVRLDETLQPLPLTLIGKLKDIASVLPRATGEDPGAPVEPAVALGQDQCELVFTRDTSQDRFPFAALFRLTDPAPNMASLEYRLALENEDDVRVPFYSGDVPSTTIIPDDAALELHLAERVQIDRPLSIEAFRDGLSGRTSDGGRPGPTGVPLAGSLSIGYVVEMAQRWTPTGLSLGDLVYSLPLAPGEQQRFAVIERTATSSVVDAETLTTSEQVASSESDDTSASATVASAFRESVAGGSSYSTDATSFSVAAAAGGGGVFPFGVAAGGVATSYGSSSASGQSDSWLSGARSSTTNSAQSTHASTQRQAAARRSSARTAMRLATAHESSSVVTKVITNHNKTRALTMQYWEVLRNYQVTTAIEGVNLVCLIPLDVVRTLRPGQPPQLDVTPTTRREVLDRYGALLDNVDVLHRTVPARYQQGLSFLSQFAADPGATVQGASDAAEDVLAVTLTGTFLPMEDVFVSVTARSGLRVGPVRMDQKAAPVPGTDTPEGRFSSEDELIAHLRRTRSGGAVEATASVALPPSVPRQDVVGFEITRRFRRFDYQLAPPEAYDAKAAGTILGVTGADLTSLIGTLGTGRSRPVSLTPDALESALGGPSLQSFAADLGGTSTSVGPASTSAGLVVAQARWSAGLELGTGPLPIAARVISPVLAYTSLLEIEKTLQWTIRHTMSVSIAIFASLTPEERTVLLERYEIHVPYAPTEGEEETEDRAEERRSGVVRVPLLSCVSNDVLGYYGNSMVLPFQIPVAVTRATASATPGRKKTGLTTGELQAALLRFHTEGFEPLRTTIALPTKGVLGEAVLGHCSAAEKIDLLRFWNWQDSPGDAAPEIGAVTVPSDNLMTGLAAPNSLPGMDPVITNVNTTGASPVTDLASAIVTAAAGQKDFETSFTNASGLQSLTEKTLGAAETARESAMKSATELASQAMDAALLRNGYPSTGKSGVPSLGGGTPATPKDDGTKGAGKDAKGGKGGKVGKNATGGKKNATGGTQGGSTPEKPTSVHEK